jgi:hypothetical protein
MAISNAFFVILQCIWHPGKAGRGQILAETRIAVAKLVLLRR